jgi:hypothetical protein
VSILGSNVAQSIAGSAQAERSQVQEKRSEASRSSENRARRKDEVIVKTEAVEAARRLAGNDQEEAHEDRQSHSQYTPGGNAAPHAGEPKLDLEG